MPSVSYITFKIPTSVIFNQWERIPYQPENETPIEAVNRYCNQLLGVNNVRKKGTVLFKSAPRHATFSNQDRKVSQKVPPVHCRQPIDSYV